MFVFNSNAKLINAMKAMVTFQRILVRHQTCKKIFFIITNIIKYIILNGLELEKIYLRIN